MPRYVYKCDSCGEIKQVSHSIKERLETCECGENLHRLPSMPFVFNSDNEHKSRATRIDNYISDAKEDLETSKDDREEYE
jgi:putative FmdB family regulatory protein